MPLNKHIMNPKKSFLFSILLAIPLAISFSAIADDPPPLPCPTCPPSSGDDSNFQARPEYATNALLIRVASIHAGSVLVFTNQPWQLSTNNLLVSGATTWTNWYALTNQTWTYRLGVINTDTNHLYSIRKASAVQGTYSQAVSFIGVNQVEYFTNQTGAAFVGNNFWRAQQEDGFLIWHPSITAGTPGTACGMTYVGYGNYIKSAPAFGWTQAGGSGTVKDVTRSNTKIVWLDHLTQFGCGSGTGVTIPYMSGSKFRFTLYVSNNVPTGPYPLLLTGFNP